MDAYLKAYRIVAWHTLFRTQWTHNFAHTHTLNIDRDLIEFVTHSALNCEYHGTRLLHFCNEKRFTQNEQVGRASPELPATSAFNIANTYEGYSKSSVTNGFPYPRTMCAWLILCINILHSIIHAHVKFRRNQANINKVIKVASVIYTSLYLKMKRGKRWTRRF